MNKAMVYITIADQESLKSIFEEGLSKGLFKSQSIEKMNDILNSKSYPIQIPIELDNVIDLIGNPIVRKMVGKKVDEAVNTCLQKVLEAG